MYKNPSQACMHAVRTIITKKRTRKRVQHGGDKCALFKCPPMTVF